MKLSVTIITFNEAANIERAIRSVSFAHEIIVVDSGSTDQTRILAEQLGARVYVHPFQGFGKQKNLAASYCQEEWIFNLDADEEVSSELALSLQNLQPQATQALFKMSRLTFFCKKPIYHGGWYPDYKARLYKKDQVNWTEPHVHEDLQCLDSSSSSVSLLPGFIYHYSFPTVESQVETNFRYAKLGARDLLARKKRRPYLGEVLLRPFLKFMECYVVKLGFLDKIPGLIIAINAAYSMFMKYSFAYYNSELQISTAHGKPNEKSD